MLVVLLRDMGHVVDYAINGYAGLEIAYAADRYREQSEAAGCHLHLVKPVPIAVLEEVLE